MISIWTSRGRETLFPMLYSQMWGAQEDSFFSRQGINTRGLTRSQAVHHTVAFLHALYDDLYVGHTGEVHGGQFHRLARAQGPAQTRHSCISAAL